ncbi:MAG: hypothetical protein ACI8YI_001979 [Paracoccaceae bacterium]|jgi:uncharacterized protein (DUF1501 family)
MPRLINPDRRKFLLRTAALGCSAAASPFVTPITLAAAPWDTRLVVIILRGGMDGLDVVRPVGDVDFGVHRPNLSTAGDAINLDGYFAMNGHLGALAPMWQAGELGFAHAVSTPYRDKRSHFDGQDLLEAGTGMDVGIEAVRDGWLNRMLAQVPGVTAKTAFAVGREDMILLNGDIPVSSWSPNARLDLSPQGKRLLEALYHDDPMFQEAGNTASELAEMLDMGSESGVGEDGVSQEMMASMQAAGKSARARALARFAGERLNEDTRIAAFSIGGWDTHRAQANGIKRALGELGDAFVTLKSMLGSNWQKTAVIGMTEFGRTVRENGSSGTDHGTGGVMLMAGGAVRGGRVYGEWPGLGETALYENRDLMPTGDVRGYAAHAMRGLFGLERSVLESSIFPGLDMGSDPRILL